MVGHSLGGSVVLDMQNTISRYIFFKTTTYGGPIKSITAPDGEHHRRFRNIGDIIFILDRGATTGIKASLIQNLITHDDPIKASTVVYQALDNHSYDGFGNQQIDNTSRDTFVYK